jgi:cytidylate kinase
MKARRGTPSPPHPPIVTVAAEHGAGGDLVAPRVADALGVAFLDRALPASLEAAGEAERQSSLVGRLARTSSVLADEQVERIDSDEGRIRSELAEFLTRASTAGGVVLGRGGVFALADESEALHVLLTGDHEGRVARVAEREGVDRAVAGRRVRALDRARKDYMQRVYGADADDRTHYHLVVNTVALGIDASVELVIAASRIRTGQPPKES